MSVLLPLGGLSGGQQIGLLRAYSDPVIFRDDRVLKTLLRKEVKYLHYIKKQKLVDKKSNDAQKQTNFRMKLYEVTWILI